LQKSRLANRPEARLAGSLALAAAAWRQGAQIIRVHDVAETAQALAVEAALRASRQLILDCFECL
jgi:dihydropteroate synthase